MIDVIAKAGAWTNPGRKSSTSYYILYLLSQYLSSQLVFIVEVEPALDLLKVCLHGHTGPTPCLERHHGMPAPRRQKPHNIITNR